MAKRRKRPSLSLPLPFPLPRFIQACTLSRTFSTARHGDNIAGTNTANRLPRGFPSLRIFVSPRPTGFYATGGEGNFKPEEGGRRKKVTFLPPPSHDIDRSNLQLFPPFLRRWRTRIYNCVENIVSRMRVSHVIRETK